VEPIVVAIISVVGGLASGLLVALGKPLAEDWQARQRERRARRLEDLDRMADGIRRPGTDGHFLSIGAASIGDHDLTEYVGRLIVAASPEARSDAQGDAATRIGQLRNKL
jgi:hypothetical protein